MATAVQSQKPSRRNVHTREQLLARLDYDPETGIFRRRAGRGKARAGSEVTTVHGPGYLKVRIDRKPYFLHRLAWLFVTGEWPVHQIDHRNGDRGDNRFANLRQATHAQNNWNTGPKNGASGLKGAYRSHTHKWRSQIKKNGKLYALGYFSTAEEAHAAYCAKARELFGEFARVS